MKTSDKVVKNLYENRTPIVDACSKVQLSVKEKESGGTPTFKTEVIEQPCKRIDGLYCSSCAYPDKKWRLGICNMASHLYIDNKAGQPLRFITPLNMEIGDFQENVKFINPIKQSKRGKK